MTSKYENCVHSRKNPYDGASQALGTRASFFHIFKVKNDQSNILYVSYETNSVEEIFWAND